MSDERRPGYIAKTTDADPSLLQSVDELEAKCFEALQNKKMLLALELPVLLWLDIVSEIRDRNPRNYSQLLRDDTMQRLEEAIERLHEEALFLVAHGPAQTVSERFHPQRQKQRRDIASDELKRSLRESGFKP